MSSPASIKGDRSADGVVDLGLICDGCRVAGGAPAWSTVARYSVAGGIAGALLAAVPGFIDFLSIEEPRMKRIAVMHMSVNLAAVAVFAVNLFVRSRIADGGPIPFILSLAGVLLIGLGGWWGGEMVYVKGMAVRPVEQKR